ncbi:MAG TPA: FAD-binding dehydrogenase [Acidobacteriota bacterium]
MSAARQYRADVVVIGGGLAGMVTALELLDAGRSVVLLDRAAEERFGGLASWSFGGIFFVASPEQRKSGVTDSVDLAWEDWVRYGELAPSDPWPYRWAEAYVNRCTEEVRGWLHRLGVRFLPVVNWTERGYSVAGNSVPRFHIAWGCGTGVVGPIQARLEAHRRAGRLTLGFQHAVEAFDRSAGRVTGCHGSAGGNPISARGEAVVIACGGIAGNLDKVRALWPWGEPPELLLNGSMPEADGRLLEVAAGLGAQVTHLETMWNYAAGVRHWKPLFPDHGLSLVPGKSALWVNYQGRRFSDPPLMGSYDTRLLVERICRAPKKVSWQILNRRIADREFAVSGAEFNAAIRDRRRARFLWQLLRGNGRQVREFIEHCPDFVTAGSATELAAKMNALSGTDDVDPELLACEIADFDLKMAGGDGPEADDQLRRIAEVRRWKGDRLRTCRRARILDPAARPLIAIRTQILTRKSLGGLQVDLQARVLDQQGEPLPGLYAVGEACGFGGGGMHGKRSLEGTFLGGCVFTGRVASRAILTGKGIA